MSVDVQGLEMDDIFQTNQFAFAFLEILQIFHYSISFSFQTRPKIHFSLNTNSLKNQNLVCLTLAHFGELIGKEIPNSVLFHFLAFFVKMSSNTSISFAEALHLNTVLLPLDQFNQKCHP